MLPCVHCCRAVNVLQATAHTQSVCDTAMGYASLLACQHAIKDDGCKMPACDKAIHEMVWAHCHLLHAMPLLLTVSAFRCAAARQLQIVALMISILCQQAGCFKMFCSNVALLQSAARQRDCFSNQLALCIAARLHITGTQYTTACTRRPRRCA